MKTILLVLALITTLSFNAQVYQLPEVDAAPIFAKGKMTSENFLDYYLQFPKTEYDKGITGNVTLAFVVDSTGMVTDVKVKNSLTPALDAEALRVASLFPFYTPARKDGKEVASKILFSVPFMSSNSKVVATTNPVLTVAPTDKTPKNPLYVVNDKILQQDENVNPQDIKKIRVVKGQKAIDLYGMRAKDGLILIETK